MAFFLEQENNRVVSARRGSNQPIELQKAYWDGHRSLRLVMPQGHVGLATATYSYQLTQDERCDVARRLAALWNLAADREWTTAQIEASLPSPTPEG